MITNAQIEALLEDIDAKIEAFFALTNVELEPYEHEDMVRAFVPFIHELASEVAQTVAAQASGAALTIVENVRAVTTSNVNLTVGGIQDIDGAAGFDGMLVLVAGQTNAVQNGIYAMRSGAWERAVGYTTAASLSHIIVPIIEGEKGGVYAQTLQLPDMNANKRFQVLFPGSAIKEAASSSQRIVRKKAFRATVGNQTVFYVKDKVNGGEIEDVDIRMPNLTYQLEHDDVDTEWVYDNQTGLLTLDAAVGAYIQEGTKIRLHVAESGNVVGGQFELVALGNNLYWKLSHQSVSQLKLIGSLNVIPGFVTVNNSVDFNILQNSNSPLIITRPDENSGWIVLPGAPDKVQKLLTYTDENS